MKKLVLSAIMVAMVVTLLPLTGVAADDEAYENQWSSKCGANFFTSQYAYSYGDQLQMLDMSTKIVSTSWYTTWVVASVKGNLYGKTWGGTTIYLGFYEVMSDWNSSDGGEHPGPDNWSTADDRFATLSMSFEVYHAARGIFPWNRYQRYWNGDMSAGHGTAVITFE